MKPSQFSILAADLLVLLKRDEDLWFTIWESQQARRKLAQVIRFKTHQIELELEKITAREKEIKSG